MFSKREKSSHEQAIARDLEDLQTIIKANYFGDEKNPAYKDAMVGYKTLKKELSQAAGDSEKLNKIDDKVRIARNTQKKIELEINARNQNTLHL